MDAGRFDLLAADRAAANANAMGDTSQRPADQQGLYSCFSNTTPGSLKRRAGTAV